MPLLDICLIACAIGVGITCLAIGGGVAALWLLEKFNDWVDGSRD